MQRIALAAGSLALVATAAVAYAAPWHGYGQVASSGCELLPSDGAQDWVTYGDYLVELTAVSVTRIPPSSDETDSGPAHIGRSVTMAVSKSLWRRPSARGLPELPETLPIFNGAWEVHGTTERPVLAGLEWLEPGEKLLPILSYTNPGDGPEWWSLQSFYEADGVVRFGDDTEMTPGLAAVDGQTPPQVARLLAQTLVDPAAVPYLTVDPVDRYRRTVSADGAPAELGPGEKE